MHTIALRQLMGDEHIRRYHNPAVNLATCIPILGVIPTLVQEHSLADALVREVATMPQNSARITHLFVDKKWYKVLSVARELMTLAISVSLTATRIFNPIVGASWIGFSLGHMGYQIFAILYNGQSVEAFRKGHVYKVPIF